MKTTAMGVGAAAGVGGASRYGMVGNARAVPPLLLAGAAGAAGLGYLLKAGVDKYLGDTRDYSGFTGADAQIAQSKEGLLSMKSADERVMTSIQNNIGNSKNVALPKGKAAIIEVMNNGGTESESITAMTDALDGYYSTIEENIITHSNSQVDQILHIINSLDNNENTAATDVFQVVRSWSGGKENSDTEGLSTTSGTNSYTTLDGTELQLKYVSAGLPDSENGKYAPALYEKSISSGNVYFKMKVNGDVEQVFSYHENILGNISAERDSVVATLSTFANDVFNQYDPGDIPIKDLIDPVTAATELSTNNEVSFAEASAGLMGIGTSSAFALTLEIQDDGGGTTETDGEIYTDAQPTDVDGNNTGFVVGETYDPADYTEPIYLSYRYMDPETGEESADFTQIENPFTVLEATSNGETVNEVTVEKNVNQTADVTKIEEELAALRAEQERLQDEAEDSGAGAGAGFFGDLGSDGQTLGLVAAGGALIALLLGRN